MANVGVFAVVNDLVSVREFLSHAKSEFQERWDSPTKVCHDIIVEK